ncbi:hypothetical protein YC2023_056384 [Brassica napus]
MIQLSPYLLCVIHARLVKDIDCEALLNFKTGPRDRPQRWVWRIARRMLTEMVAMT